jgi:transcription initiation factor TFIIB
LNADLNLPAPPPRPHEFVPRLATAVDVPHPVEQYALELLDAPGMDSFANGRNPRCVAAGCLYYAARELLGYGDVTQGELADAANISHVSLRSVWQALSEFEKADSGDSLPAPS